MDIDIKDMAQQDMKGLVESLELVSARILDTVITTSQIACSSTPEMRELFRQWISCLGGEIEEEARESGRIDPYALSLKIGVTPATVMSLALAMHREGRIAIKAIEAVPGKGENTEICGCMKIK